MYTRSTLTPEEAAEHDRVFGDLAEATAALADVQLRTLIEAVEAEKVTAEIRSLTERLARLARPGALGTEIGPVGHAIRNHGNAVMGLRNPLAAVRAGSRRVDDDKHVHYAVRLGALYEGPPGLVHGGVSALILDQLLGETASVAGGPGMTGRLTVHYRRPTPLGEVTMEGWLESHTGRKSIVRGVVRDASGTTTIEAEGLFILPKWATEWAGGESRPFE